MGNMNSEIQYTYFRHNAQPKTGDWVLLVGWLQQKPTDIKEAQEILTAVPMRGLKGRLEFSVVTVIRRPESLRQFTKLLRKRVPLGDVKDPTPKGGGL